MWMTCLTFGAKCGSRAAKGEMLAGAPVELSHIRLARPAIPRPVPSWVSIWRRDRFCMVQSLIQIHQLIRREEYLGKFFPGIELRVCVRRNRHKLQGEVDLSLAGIPTEYCLIHGLDSFRWVA